MTVVILSFTATVLPSGDKNSKYWFGKYGHKQ